MRLLLAVCASGYPASSCDREGGGETAGRAHSSGIPAIAHTKLTADLPRVEYAPGERSLPPGGPCNNAGGAPSLDPSWDAENRPLFQDEVPDGSLTASVIDSRCR
jgi:hypothetical protein